MKRCVAVVLGMWLTVALAAQGRIDGRWESAQKDGKPVAGTDVMTFTFTVAGQALTGNVEIGGGKFEIESGKVAKNTISFAWTTDFPPGGNPVRRTAQGTVNDNQIDLAVEVLVESTRAKSKETIVLKRAK